MSEMSFREPNQVLWRGVRPAHLGTQILKYADANAATVVVHTVSAGKVFYLTFFSHTGFLSAAGEVSELIIRNAADALQLRLSRFESPASETLSVAVGLNFPIEIPALWDIAIYSSNAGIVSYGSIAGWEE